MVNEASAALARQIQEELRAELDLRRTDVVRLGDAPLRELATRLARRSVARRALPPGVESEALIRTTMSERRTAFPAS